MAYVAHLQSHFRKLNAEKNGLQKALMVLEYEKGKMAELVGQEAALEREAMDLGSEISGVVERLLASKTWNSELKGEVETKEEGEREMVAASAEIIKAARESIAIFGEMVNQAERELDGSNKTWSQSLLPLAAASAALVLGSLWYASANFSL